MAYGHVVRDRHPGGADGARALRAAAASWTRRCSKPRWPGWRARSRRFWRRGICRAGAGSGVYEIVPYQAFAASDGYVMVAAGNDGLFVKLCGALGRADLAMDQRFRTNADRVLNRAALVDYLQGEFARAPVADWVRRLQRSGRSRRAAAYGSTRSWPTHRRRRSG
ncbi:MAG: CoA transferase [Acetobacteraceae bacterium]